MNEFVAQKSIYTILKELYAKQESELYYKTFVGKLDFLEQNKSQIPFLSTIQKLKELQLIEFVFELNGYHTSYAIGTKTMKKESLEFLLDLLLNQSVYTLLQFLELTTKNNTKLYELLIEQLRIKVPSITEQG